MAELYDDWVVRPLSRDEFKLLSDEDKKERRLAQKRIYSRKQYEENTEKERERNRKYKENNPEKEKERSRKYYEENTEKVKEINRLWQQTPAGKKQHTLSHWKTRNLQETPEEMERIYELRETQELCSSCDVKLTRDGDKSSTDASMDHCHITNRFRQICCKNCNHYDNWKKFWVDGIYGGRRI